MKRITAMLMVLVIIAAMTACSSHTHTEDENWEADSVGHWKVCKECGEKTQTGDHTLNDNSKCTVCASDILVWDDSVSVYSYDKYENIIRMADYDTDGKLISETVNEYEYDTNGNITKGKEYIDGKLSSETEYTVSDGESISAKYTQYNEDGSKFVNKYDSYGNVIVLIDYDAEGNVSLQINSEYAENDDGEWYEKSATEIYGDGTKIEAEYNEHGDNTSRVIYGADGSITSTESWEYTYDDNGFATTEKAYVDGVLNTETVYKIVIEDDGMFSYPETVTTYDKDGSKTVCVYDENDELVSETKYDASGNVVE